MKRTFVRRAAVLCSALLIIVQTSFGQDSCPDYGAGSFKRADGGDPNCANLCDRCMTVVGGDRDYEVGEDVTLTFTAPLAHGGH